MSRLVLCTLSVALFAGCVSSGGIAKIVTAAAKDPASVHLRVQSGTVTVEYDRTNPATNSVSHKVGDGGVTVGQ